ncbi:hypothetical protein NM688_g8826 [Phlebia brevispora]|uniref:Uncharacterized protein n=1 Tax=Phlebia brevispora TaxID=194682 RepID=A0ACC1RPE5_9APHY|nr:hypothetical protein NM688_g8826 [Phlebia brevispora]
MSHTNDTKVLRTIAGVGSAAVHTIDEAGPLPNKSVILPSYSRSASVRAVLEGMFPKLVFILTLSGLGLQAYAHAIITPALDVNGTGTRNDVQRPTNTSMCGGVNITAALPSSITIPLQAGGIFSANITNFNGGQDGSRQVTAAVDRTATGANFTSATVKQNGDLVPTSVGSQTLIVEMPPGTVCSGSPSENLCLVSFKTAGGFGNCVVVRESAADKCMMVGRKTRRSLDMARRDVLDVRATGTRAARVLKRAWNEWI